MSKQVQALHVVAVPLAAQGHINPLMRFCRVLASHGLRITFVDIDPVHHRLEHVHGGVQQEEGREAAAAADGGENDVHVEHNIRRVHIPIEGLDLTSDFRVSFEHFFKAQNSIAPHLEALVRKLNRDGDPVSCLISDICMTIPTQKVADVLNIPRIVLYTNCASMHLLVTYALQGKHITVKQVLKALGKKGAREEVFCEGLPGLPAILHVGDLLDIKHVTDDNPYMWEYFIMESWQQSNGRALAVVINSFDELEGSAFKALSDNAELPVYGVGPLVEPLGTKKTATSLWKEDEACLLWLDEQPAQSVLYISFGSVAVLSEAQFGEIVAGLLSSQQRFLWVFRTGLVENIAYSAFSSDVSSRFHGRGYVVDWAPQMRVLSHPSVGGFLTHCGWNSVMEAISCGMPMLCWPYFCDQFLDAKLVVALWKVGLRFESKGSLVERHEIERAIRAVMQGTEEGGALRENAKRLKEACYQSLLPGGSSHKKIQMLVELLMEKASLEAEALGSMC